MSNFANELTTLIMITMKTGQTRWNLWLLFMSALLLPAALLMVSCSRGGYSRELVVADSLTETAPDSAVRYLRALSGTYIHAPERQQMYYRLLCIKATDKAYIPQKSDREILQIVNYYEHGGDKSLLPTAYYYAGSAYRDLNDAPQALEYFYKAASALPKNRYLKLRSNIFNQTGRLLSYQCLYEEALKMYRQSYQCDRLRRDTAEMINSLRDIGNIYESMGRKDSCYIFYSKACELAEKYRDKGAIIGSRAQMALYYCDTKQYGKAHDCIGPALADGTRTGKSATYSIALEISMAMQKYDSALYYCNKLQSCGTIYAQKHANLCRLKLLLISEKDTKALDALNRYEHSDDSVGNITTTRSADNVNTLYKHKEREKELLELRMERLKSISTITASTFGALLIVAILVLYMRKQARLQKKRRRLYDEIKRMQESSGMRQIEKNEKEIAKLNAALADAVKDREELALQIQRQKDELVMLNEIVKTKNNVMKLCTSNLKSTDIYTKIMERIQQGKVLNTTEWQELDRQINNIIIGFHSNLVSQCNVSRHEYQVCMLIRCGIDISDIGLLMSRTSSAVSKVRTRLQKKCFGGNGNAKDFDAFVNSL